jgi:mercuric ion transport protein
MQKYLGFSYLASFGALGVASCCVLPVTMMLLGLGGSWLAVFGKIAAASYYVLAISTVLVSASWAISFQRKSMSKLKWWLGVPTVLTALAWVVVVNATPINDFLITQM